MINCCEAKKRSLVSILEKIGAKKVKESNREIWYLSPFRNEHTASFKIDIRKNIFYDHGEGFGGNVLDFVMKYYGCDLKDALQILDNESFSFHQPIFQKHCACEKENKYEIRAVKKLTNANLIDYIQSRNINVRFAKKYCVELHYSLNDNPYYGIGFLNIANGYEIRNKYVKMCLGTKAVSYFENDANRIILFESWSDFLSFLTLYPKAEERYDYLILNSVGTLNNVLIEKTNGYLYKCIKEDFDIFTNIQINNCKVNTLYQELKYDTIICCFDNDTAGNRATDKVINTFPKLVKDGRLLYPNHKDLNEFLMTK